MKTINSATLQRFQDEANTVLEKLASKHGLQSLRCSVRYGTAEFKMTAEFKLLETADGKNPAKIRWNDYCELYQMKKTWFGKSFTCRQGTFKIVGLNSSKRKNIVTCILKGTNDDWNFPASAIRQNMAMK